MESELSSYGKSLLLILKERLNTSEEVIEEAILCLFRESQGESGAQKVGNFKQPTPLIEVMDKFGLLD